ncbi:hypothetical protein PILCRDRAFT_81557, partial [Piloderma croceum F 1598]
MSAAASAASIPPSVNSIDTLVKWNVDDETAMINYLIDNRSCAGNGANFKDTIWSGVAAALESQRTEGGVKTAKKCKEKWQWLQTTVNTVTSIISSSSFSWDDKNSFDVSPEKQSLWDAYIAKHAAAKPFKKQGWPHYTAMAEIVPQKT